VRQSFLYSQNPRFSSENAGFFAPAFQIFRAKRF